MTLRDYLELRLKGWEDSAADLTDLPVVMERYRAKTAELNQILEHLDDSTLNTPVSFKKRG